MQRIERKTTIVETYVGDHGPIPVKEMSNQHMVAALLKAERSENKVVVETLRAELLRRLK